MNDKNPTTPTDLEPDGSASETKTEGALPDEGMSKSLVLVVYGAALDGEILEGLESLELRSFTRWTRVHGRGHTSAPHLDSHVWPGTNNVLALVMDPAAVPPLLSWLRDLKTRVSQEGLRAFVLPVGDYV